MAGLRAWFRQVAQAVEEEVAKQRGDSLRARPGYGTYGNEEPEPDAVWESERETGRAPTQPWRAETVRSPWSRNAPESPAPASATRRAPEMRGAQHPGHSSWDTNGLRESQPYAHASPTDAVMARIRARLGTPDALREAFVIKEILDRPLARRRTR
ncbi:MAG: hypothetical protein OXQ84_05630 [bacterium]|nr:hypothetical protein [bacterium]